MLYSDRAADNIIRETHDKHKTLTRRQLQAIGKPTHSPSVGWTPMYTGRDILLHTEF